MNRIKTTLKKYKLIPIQVKAAFWFTVCSIIQNGLHLITMPIYTRILTTEQYGLSTLYFAWFDIVVIFSSLRLTAGVFNNGMVHYSEDRDRFQSSMQGLSTVSSLLCLFIYMIFAKYFDSFFGLPHILMVTMFFSCVFYPSLNIWTARQRYEYKYIGFSLATLGFAIITTFFSVAFIFFSEDKGVMKIVGYAIAAIVINLFFYEASGMMVGTPPDR